MKPLKAFITAIILIMAGGYESDLNLNNVKLLGDLPVEHSLGGHAIAESQQVNKYKVVLSPPIMQYRIGLPLHITFPVTNTDSATLNVDNKGEVLIKKLTGDALINLSSGDIVVGKVYILIYNGQYFQIANSDASAFAGGIGSGRFADPFMFGSSAYSNGAFYGAKGSAQRLTLQAWGQVNAGTGITEISLDGTGTATNRWIVPLNTLQHFKIYFDIVQNSGSAGQIGDSWIATFQGAVKNVNGVLSWVRLYPFRNAPSMIFIRNDAALFPVVSFVLSGNNVVPTIKQIAGKNLFANAVIHINQTKFHLPVPVLISPGFEPPVEPPIIEV